MAGKSKVRATQEDRDALRALSCSSDRGEADRSRAMLLTLEGWTSCRIAKAFGVREDTVRQWRSDFMKGGIDALKTRKASGPIADKIDQTALRVAERRCSRIRLWPVPDWPNLYPAVHLKLRGAKAFPSVPCRLIQGPSKGPFCR